MRFPTPLVPGRLVRRYKRFLADVALGDGTVVTAHCANSGAMTGVDTPGSAVWLSRAASPARKLAYTLEIVQADSAQGPTLVGVNTGHPNRIAAEAIAAGAIPALAGYTRVRREVAYGRNSRIDLLLEGPDRPAAYVEVKYVHMRRGGEPLAEFPDCRTERGTKHLGELEAVARAGHRAVMLYLVQRDDCHRFRVAADIDPAYDRALASALAAGVEAHCHACRVTVDGIELAHPVEVLAPAAVRSEVAA